MGVAESESVGKNEVVVKERSVPVAGFGTVDMSLTDGLVMMGRELGATGVTKITEAVDCAKS